MDAEWEANPVKYLAVDAVNNGAAIAAEKISTLTVVEEVEHSTRKAPFELSTYTLVAIGP